MTPSSAGVSEGAIERPDDRQPGLTGESHKQGTPVAFPGSWHLDRNCPAGQGSGRGAGQPRGPSLGCQALPLPGPQFRAVTSTSSFFCFGGLHREGAPSARGWGVLRGRGNGRSVGGESTPGLCWHPHQCLAESTAHPLKVKAESDENKCLEGWAKKWSDGYS